MWCKSKSSRYYHPFDLFSVKLKLKFLDPVDFPIKKQGVSSKKREGTWLLQEALFLMGFDISERNKILSVILQGF